MPLKDAFNDTWDIGIGLSWTLWDWGSRSAKSKQARQQLLQVETHHALLKEAIQTEVRKNYLNLASQKQRVSAARLFLESATENYRVSTEKFNTQMLTTTDLLDAEVNLFQAKTSYQTARVDLELARVQLLKSAGEKIY